MIPKTIEELRAWYNAYGFPPEQVTRFFIGTDYREPRAFGIYRDGERFVVYKNKDDGSRAIRYEGPDEAYAVKELYLRLMKEVDNQRLHGHNAVPGLDTDTGHTETAPIRQKPPQERKPFDPQAYAEAEQKRAAKRKRIIEIVLAVLAAGLLFRFFCYPSIAADRAAQSGDYETAVRTVGCNAVCRLLYADQYHACIEKLEEQAKEQKEAGAYEQAAKSYQFLAQLYSGVLKG